MKKLSQFKDNEKRTIVDEIDAHASVVEIDGYSNSTVGDVAIDIGLCTKCKRLVCTSTEYGTVYAKCDEWEMRLNLSNRVKHCNRFRQRGQMALYEMKDIAIIIDINKKEIGLLT